MKTKGEFLEQTKRNVQRQKLFDKAKQARELKEDFLIALDSKRYKLRPLSLDENILYGDSDYIVFIKGKHRIATGPRNKEVDYWYTYIGDERNLYLEQYRISSKKMLSVIVGRILEEFDS